MNRFPLPIFAILCAAASVLAQPKTVTIATTYIRDAGELRVLSAQFENENPDIKLEWSTINYRDMRQRVIADMVSGLGQFDTILIGMYDTAIFAKQGWLKPIGNLPADYDLEDVFKSLRDGLSYQGKLYALPFTGESSMLMYRKDLFAARDFKMPDQPKYEEIEQFAHALTNKAEGMYGIALRGRPGWGENMAYIGTLINTFGGAWFDNEWHPTIDTTEWKKAIRFYRKLLHETGPPGANSDGFSENLSLFSNGKAAMWIDSTNAGGILEDDKQSQVAGKIGYVSAPIEVTSKGSHWLWSWAFAIPKTAKNPEAAQKFAQWATSREYIKLAAGHSGWPSVPAGTRKSTYENDDYRKLPYAETSLKAMQSADPTNPTIKKVPYTGIQFVDIPEFEQLGNLVGEEIAGTLAGATDVDPALRDCQKAAERILKASEPAPTPFTTPSATPLPIAKDKQCQPVLYVTNRVRKTDASLANQFPEFTYERTQELTFGSAVIRVPENHKFGHIEKPELKWYEGMPVLEEEDRTRHFTMPDLRVLTKEEFLNRISTNQTSSALLFVHGFNTGFRDALEELAQIAFDTNYSGVAIAFAWPSRGAIDVEVQPVEALVAYNYDRESAKYSQDSFLEVLRLLRTSAHVSKLYVIAHSMGNQLVINAIDQASCGGERLSITEMVLAAPDVDWDLFKLSGYRLMAAASGITLYASAADKALAFSVKWNGQSRAGFIPEPGRPFIFPGILTIDVTALGDDMFGFNHDTYRTKRSVLNDIGQIVTDGKHVSEIRSRPEGYSVFPP